MKLFNFSKITLLCYGLFFLFLSCFKIFKKQKDSLNLIFYSGKLGDIVCLTPLFKVLKKNDPQTKLFIILRKQFADILDDNPYLDEKIIFTDEKEFKKITWWWRNWSKINNFSLKYYFNLNGNFEGGIFGLSFLSKKRLGFSSIFNDKSQNFLNFFYKTENFKYDRPLKEYYFDMLKKIGMCVEDKKNQIFFLDKELEEKIKEDFYKKNNLKNKKIIGIFLGSGKDFKRWPDNYWLELINDLKTKFSVEIIFFGTKKEGEKIKEIQSVLKFKTFSVVDVALKELPYFLKICSIVIGVDTGPIYVADALSIPVIDIMGPNNQLNQKPENNYRLVIKQENCSKLLITPTPASFYKYINEFKKCFEETKPRDVLAAVYDLMPN